MKTNKAIPTILFLIGLIFFSWVAWNSTRIAGGEDGVQHHLIAKYVPEHPTNLLDHWGKPLYTLMSAPFAQFGFFGSQLFNILCGLFAALLTWLTARKLGLRMPWMAAAFLLFSTMYFFCIPSSITEVLFSLNLIAAVYLLTIKKPAWAALVISFIPFVRTEGNIIIFMFLVALVALRHYKSIPWLAFGFVAYSFAGYFHFDDLLWVIHQNPYGDASDIYGRGEFLHYVNEPRAIWGNVIFALMILGSIWFTIRLTRMLIKEKGLTREQHVLLWLVFGCFYAYLFGHSYVWWKGISASLGLKRVMAGTMPVAAIIAAYGWHRILDSFNPRLKAFSIISSLALLLVVSSACLSENQVPYHGDREREMLLEAGDWFMQSDERVAGNKVYYFAPSAAQAFGVDPFDSNQRGDLSAVKPEGELEENAVIVWDAHFGPNECHLPLEELKNRKDLKIIAHFEPDDPFTTLNDYPYEIYLFKQQDQSNKP